MLFKNATTATSPYSDVLRYSKLMDVICSSLDQDDEITRSLDLTEVVEDKWQLATSSCFLTNFPIYLP